MCAPFDFILNCLAVFFITKLDDLSEPESLLKEVANAVHHYDDDLKKFLRGTLGTIPDTPASQALTRMASSLRQASSDFGWLKGS
jgi:hypothetical protein